MFGIAAHEVLSDSQKRRIYDQYGEEGLKGGAGGAGGSPFQFHFNFDDFFQGFNPFEGFDNMAGGNDHAQQAFQFNFGDFGGDPFGGFGDRHEVHDEVRQGHDPFEGMGDMFGGGGFFQRTEQQPGWSDFSVCMF